MRNNKSSLSGLMVLFIIYAIIFSRSIRAAKNSDFVRIIGFLNPPLQIRTDICATNGLFGFGTRYKIGINFNYSLLIN